MSLYGDHSVCVAVGTGISPWLNIQSGFKQGCAISAWLFNLFSDSCPKKWKQSDMRMKGGDLSLHCIMRVHVAGISHYSERKVWK